MRAAAVAPSVDGGPWHTDLVTQPEQRVDLAAIYRHSRLRLTEVVAGVDDPKDVAVPCCPGWSVHDVLSHLVAGAEDVLAGRLTGPPDDQQTASQVARRADVPTGAVLKEWGRFGPDIEALLERAEIWPLAIDVLTHEHDVRGAIGDKGARSDPAVKITAAGLLRRLNPPVALVVQCEDDRISVGPQDDGPPLELSTDAFEAFRFRMGRRSRRQLAAMRWSGGDPEATIDHLTIFGPSPLDIAE